MPFGAVAAVYAWDRLAALFTSVACRALGVAVNRYVDDLFFVDFACSAVATRSRLFRVASWFGLVLALAKTPEPSTSLEVLGVLVDVSAAGQVSLSLVARKVERWLVVIDEALESRRLAPRSCESLVGKLSFAVGAVWGPGVRSRLVELYRHVGQRSAEFDEPVARALTWWASALRGHLAPRRIGLGPPSRPPVVVYTDAEGSGGVGFVIIDCASDWRGCGSATVGDAWARTLLSRRTQIVPFEVAAVLVALLSCTERVQGRRLVVWVDNSAARAVLKSGRSRKSDLNALAAVFHRILADANASARVEWVPSRLNPADPPSRGRPPPFACHRIDVSGHVGSRLSD